MSHSKKKMILVLILYYINCTKIHFFLNGTFLQRSIQESFIFSINISSNLNF
nr:MAG TPA: hypothetical protein [Caudoviricetes sp.]